MRSQSLGGKPGCDPLHLRRGARTKPSKRVHRSDLMMNNSYGGMGGGMWVWTLICILVVVLLVVMINKVFTK